MVKEEDPAVKIKILRSDAEKALAKKNYKEAAKCFNYIGVIYSEQEDHENSLKFHQEELKCSEKAKDRLSVGVAHRKIGEAYSLLGQFHKSAQHLKEYLGAATELKDQEELQRAETTLGRTYWLHYCADNKKNEKSLLRAAAYYKSALTRASNLKGKIPEKNYAQMKSRCLLNLALVHEQKDVKVALRLLDDAILLSKKFGFAEDLLRCQNALIGINTRAGSVHSARQICDDAMKVAKQLKDYTNLCEIILLKANILITLIDFDGARHLFKKAYHYHSKSTDSDHREKAVKGYKLTKKINETLREINLSTDLEVHVKLYDKIGDYCVELGCYSTAIDYYKRELDSALKLGKSGEELAIIYFSLGQTYFDNQQFSESLEAYQKELTLRAGNPRDEVFSLLKIIEIKICLNHTFEEIQREYEYTLTKCVDDKYKRLVLNDYKKYLDDAKITTYASREIEKQLQELGSAEESEMECEDDKECETTNVELSSDDEVSDLTGDSETENTEEQETKGKALRTRHNGRRIQSSKVNEKGETALHRACIDGNLSLVIKLIEGGHEVNCRDHAGWLPIHEAANHGYAEIVKYLITKGALISDRGGPECNDTTPLHDACANGNIDVIRILIRAGAKVICRDAKGDTPYDLLKERMGDGACLKSEEKKDVAMLFKEMKELMKKAGYDFNAKVPVKVKRKHIKSDIVAKPVDNFRTHRDRSPSQSPPRKSHKPNKKREEVDAKKTYKEVISNLRRPHDLVGGPPPAKSKSKFKGLIDESEYIVDEWLINDLKPGSLKDKPVRDAYEMTANLGKKAHQYSARNKPQSKPQKISNSRVECKAQRAERLNYVSDEDEEYVIDNGDNEKSSQCANDSQDEATFDWEKQLDNKDSDNEGEDNETEIDPGRKNQRNDFFRLELERMEPASLSSTSSPASFPTSSSPPSSFQPLSSCSTPSVVPNISSCSTVSPPTTSQQPGSNSVPTKSPPTNQPNQSDGKFLVTVHLENKKLLLAVPNRSAQVSWLAEKTAERYYQMRQLRPKLSLTTEDGAILGLDDLIVDVCLDNQVYASIDSWDLEPLPDRYESSCRLKKASVNNDLKFRLKLCETSGKLQLSNMLLERETISNFLLSLRCQKSLRILDFSFSDIILLDKDDILSQILSTLPDLEEIHFKGTGLVSYRLHTLCRYPLTNLINVDFSYNSLDDRCSTNLVEFVNQCPCLKLLDLRYNDFSLNFIEDSELIQIAENKNITLLIR